MSEHRTAQPSQGSQPMSRSDAGQATDEIARRSSWVLMWRRFRRHKLAVISLIIIVFMYVVAIFADSLAPRPPGDYAVDYPYAPPQGIHLTDIGEGDGLGLYVYGMDQEVDDVTWERSYTEDREDPHRLGLFVSAGEEYRFLGMFETDVRLFGPEDPEAPFFLLGADSAGRDILSRVIFGTRVSLSIGLIGVVLSTVIGIVLGAAAGFLRGPVDAVIQRITEVFMSIPTLPLWMALAASLPQSWTPLQVYFGITVLLSLIGWTSLSREVRGRVLTLRSEDYVAAARLDGASRMRVVRRHILPALTSHIIATVTLAVPAMILAETSLSFLGLGLQPPVVSWGVLLQEAQNVRTVMTAPWLLIVPSAAVVLATLSLNFLGDGLRDAADPYGGGQ
ncbi:ABC transporter permease [Nesterenkonia aerolata]|uniref:ABC transporter permease n=1 Tax=Nesterenkonia aerolata TaxID=3074079 RepID=A0ABU2DTI1_9MICC|nr:ABC transporter permease [Nesterenkonia sp. LY-0111]MDR8019809.1 ABC transporter permease [Nesterenkonia sp. LY-0111]